LGIVNERQHRLAATAWRIVSGFPGDVAIALALAAVGSVALRYASAPAGGREADAFAYLLALVLSLPIAARRTSPEAVLAVMAAGSVAYVVRGYPSVNVDFFGPVLAFYTVASQRPRPTSIGAGVVLWLAVTGALAASPVEGENGAGTLTAAVVILAVWLFGDSVRQRRAYGDRLELQARELEHARLELAAQAVTQERLRIARDLHDVVAHHMSSIVVQAAVARESVTPEQRAAMRAIEHIESTGRSALSEIRQLLGVLMRTGDGRATEDPALGLASLGQLVERARAGGVPVETSIEGARGPIPSAVDLAAYRVLQEALTNVVRHASGSRALVSVLYRDDALNLEVINNASAKPRPPKSTDTRGGLGIPGMRERVTLLGGTFEAGPTSDGGFRVVAALPLRAAG
jgi:signal transduction histidine kinase